MATTNTKNAKPPIKHHYIRTVFASLFGSIALGLIIVSILVVWLDWTLTNTGQYVRTVAPLVAKPAVQNFVVDKASSALLDNQDAPISDLAKKLLTPEQITGKTNDQLKAQIKPIVQDNIRSVVASPAFTKLWVDTNRQAHSQIISQLNSNAPVINLNLHPLIVGVIDQLSTTKLGFVKDKLQLKDDEGTVSLKGKQLKNVHKVYNYFKAAMLAIIGCAILASVLCVLISVHHLKTLRRIALATGIYSAIIALLLSATSLFQTNRIDAGTQKMAVALVDGITHDLRLTLIVIAIVCIGGGVGSKIYAVMMTKKKATSVKRV